MHIDNTRRMGDVVQTLGTNQFASRFYGMFDELLGLKQCTVFAFSHSVRPPQSVFAEGCDNNHRFLARSLRCSAANEKRVATSSPTGILTAPSS